MSEKDKKINQLVNVKTNKTVGGTPSEIARLMTIKDGNGEYLYKTKSGFLTGFKEENGQLKQVKYTDDTLRFFGEQGQVPDLQLKRDARSGIAQDQAVQEEKRKIAEDSAGTALIRGAANTASFGAVSAAEDAILGDLDKSEELGLLTEENPVATTAGELLGVASTLVGPGLVGKAAQVSTKGLLGFSASVGSKVSTGLASRGVSQGVSKVAGLAAESVVADTVLSTQFNAAHMVDEDKPFSAQALVSSVANDVLFGLAAGGAILGAGKLISKATKAGKSASGRVLGGNLIDAANQLDGASKLDLDNLHNLSKAEMDQKVAQMGILDKAKAKAGAGIFNDSSNFQKMMADPEAVWKATPKIKEASQRITRNFAKVSNKLSNKKNLVAELRVATRQAVKKQSFDNLPNFGTEAAIAVNNIRTDIIKNGLKSENKNLLKQIDATVEALEDGSVKQGVQALLDLETFAVGSKDLAEGAITGQLLRGRLDDVYKNVITTGPELSKFLQKSSEGLRGLSAAKSSNIKKFAGKDVLLSKQFDNMSNVAESVTLNNIVDETNGFVTAFSTLEDAGVVVPQARQVLEDVSQTIVDNYRYFEGRALINSVKQATPQGSLGSVAVAGGFLSGNPVAGLAAKNLINQTDPLKFVEKQLGVYQSNLSMLKSIQNGSKLVVQSISKPTSRTLIKGAIFQYRSKSEKEKNEEFEKVSAILAPLRNPEAQMAIAEERVSNIIEQDPMLANEVSASVVDTINYSLEKLPESPKDVFNEDLYPVSSAERDSFMETYLTLSEPESLFSAIADDSLTLEMVDAVRDVYPSIYAQMVIEMADQLGQNRDKMSGIPYGKKLMLSQFLGYPLDETMSGSFIMQTQPGTQPEPQPQQGGAPVRVLKDSTMKTPREGMEIS